MILYTGNPEESVKKKKKKRLELVNWSSAKLQDVRPVFQPGTIHTTHISGSTAALGLWIQIGTMALEILLTSIIT